MFAEYERELRYTALRELSVLNDTLGTYDACTCIPVWGSVRDRVGD